MVPNKSEYIHNLLLPADLVAENQRLHQEIINEREFNLRTLADFKNYRRRIEQDGNKIVAEYKRKIMLDLLEIVDDLEKALDFDKDDMHLSVKGIRIIYEKILSLLQSNGVLPFDCLGTSFDHNLHEAVSMATHPGSEPRTVVDEIKRGYFLNNELLRPAQVRVSG